jgi:hypothetical protein
MRAARKGRAHTSLTEFMYYLRVNSTHFYSFTSHRPSAISVAFNFHSSHLSLKLIKSPENHNKIPLKIPSLFHSLPLPTLLQSILLPPASAPSRPNLSHPRLPEPSPTHRRQIIVPLRYPCLPAHPFNLGTDPAAYRAYQIADPRRDSLPCKVGGTNKYALFSKDYHEHYHND